MNIQRWIARREENWQKLNLVLQKVEKKGLRSLKALEIKELASLYRSVSGDLARAKTHDVGYILVQELQRLTNRGYNQIYQGSRRQEWQKVREFYLWGFPKIVRETWVYSGIATFIFATVGLIAWWYAWADPSFLSLVVPAELITKVRDKGELWMGSIVGVEPLASSSIAINNISVCFAAISGGITGGIYTSFIMGYNGLSIGAIAALVAQNKLSYPFWAFVFPHGALELPAIFLAGGAGLLIGRAILFPGKYRRLDALKYYGDRAAKLLFGIVPMLLIAGTIEGFFSPSPLVPEIFKYIAGVGIFWGLTIYLTFGKAIP